MKKTVLKSIKVTALGLAIFSGGMASASTSNVQLYGILDAGIRYDKSLDGNSKWGVASGIAGQSRFGLRGSEDIGNGYAVTFILEGGLDMATGHSTQGRLFGRQATLGLKGGFGEVKIGRQMIFGYTWTPFLASPFGLAWSNSSIGSTFGYKSGDYGAAGRMNNSVVYTTPSFNGLQAGIGYSFATDTEQKFQSSKNNRVLTAGVRYLSGPLRVALTFDHLNPNVDSIHNRKSQNYQLGASYDFEVVKLYAGFNEQRKINRNPAPGYISTGHDKDRAYSVGASIPVTAKSDVMLNYQHAVLSKNRGVSGAYQYKLSKRTKAYVLANAFKTRNHFDNRNENARQFAVGLQHSF